MYLLAYFNGIQKKLNFAGCDSVTHAKHMLSVNHLLLQIGFCYEATLPKPEFQQKGTMKITCSGSHFVDCLTELVKQP